jgi:hypothetical protein
MSSLPWIMLVPVYDIHVVVKASANRVKSEIFANTPKTICREMQKNSIITPNIAISDLGMKMGE